MMTEMSSIVSLMAIMIEHLFLVLPVLPNEFFVEVMLLMKVDVLVPQLALLHPVRHVPQARHVWGYLQPPGLWMGAFVLLVLASYVNLYVLTFSRPHLLHRYHRDPRAIGVAKVMLILYMKKWSLVPSLLLKLILAKGEEIQEASQ